MRTRDMRATSAPSPVALTRQLPFTVTVSKDGKQRVVTICGELDIATCNMARRACLSGRRKVVVVEMADTTFMDCSGYGGLVDARRELQRLGGSLTMRNQIGQPAELLTMLNVLEARN